MVSSCPHPYADAQSDTVPVDKAWSGRHGKRPDGDGSSRTIGRRSLPPVREPRRAVVGQSRGVNDPALARARRPRADPGVVHATARASVTGERGVAIRRADLRCRVAAICAVICDVFCSEIHPEIATNFRRGRGPTRPPIPRTDPGDGHHAFMMPLCSEPSRSRRCAPTPLRGASDPDGPCAQRVSWQLRDGRLKYADAHAFHTRCSKVSLGLASTGSAGVYSGKLLSHRSSQARAHVVTTAHEIEP